MRLLSFRYNKHNLTQVDNASKPTFQEQNILRDIVETFVFTEATEFVKVACVPSAGYVLPCIRGLNYKMKDMVSKYNTSFVLGSKQSLKNRMPYYKENDTYISAAILDPHLKNTL